ncbi:MAG: caspase family protein [Promethearchaeia archaeon]
MKNRNKILFILSILLLNFMFLSLNKIINNLIGNVKRRGEVESLKTSMRPVWIVNGTIICYAINDQNNPQICGDKEGGAIIVWQDSKNGNWDIFAQRINSSGQVLWGDNGTAICTSDNAQISPQICSDGSGGAIIIWLDDRNSPFTNLFAQRINSLGVIQWTPNGSIVSSVDCSSFFSPQIVSDNAGGAIITWTDDSHISRDIYAQRINSTGEPKWTINGVGICTASNTQDCPQICSDEEGGAIIIWHDYRDGIDYDIYAQRIDSSGNMQWTSNGVPICIANNLQLDPQMTHDGQGGAIIAWRDYRNSLWQIYTQKVNSTGETQWIPNGIKISNTNREQRFPKLCNDQAGGAIITWCDYFPPDTDIFAQKILANGTLAWGSFGNTICSAIYDQWSPEIINDGAGGAFISWVDERGNNKDVYAQRINSDGELVSPTNGFKICTADLIQDRPKVCSDLNGGFIITWHDQREGNFDIYAQRVACSRPKSNHPDDIKTAPHLSEVIEWLLTDDNGEGKYRVLTNNSVGNFYVWIDWTTWINNSIISIPINRSKTGIYNYTIEFYDDQNQFGIPDTVIVTIVDSALFPDITINLPKPNTYYGNLTCNFDLTIIEDNLNTTWYTLNNGLKYFFNGTSGSIDQIAWDNCEDGAVSITFFANNTDGYLDYEEVIVYKESKVPEIIINLPKPNTYYGNLTCNFDLTIIEDNLNTTWYTLNNGLKHFFNGTTGSINQIAWNNCEDGAVSITFYANDSAGNVGFEEININKISKLVPKTAYAIIIGIADYPGSDDDLPYCINDINSIYNWLRITLNYKEENIIRLINSEATLDGIIGAFNQIRIKIQPYDDFFFYFSGHGGAGSGSYHYVCPYDSIPSNPSKLFYDAELDFRLDQLNCERKFVIIDACNSGGIIPETQQPGRYIMTACEDWELSFMTSDLGCSVFTYFFVYAFFSLLTDTNGDGLISMEEQYSYSYSETSEYMSNYGESQHPDKYDGISGSTFLYPSIGSLTLIPTDNVLYYSFNIYGNGQLECLNLTLCSTVQDITIEMFDLRFPSPSNTGFGIYSGSIHLDEGYNISGYEIKVIVDGYNTITIKETYGDSDGDGLYDIDEILHGINPLSNDTDLDGLDDFEEFYGPTDPLLNDTDDDGMPDGYEVNNGLDPLSDDTQLDLDDDQLANIDEYILGSEPDDPDTDNDGMEDGYEYNNDLDLFNNDAGLDQDSDNLTNIIEYLYGSLANNPDSDGDSMPDGWEYEHDLDLLYDDSLLDPDDDELTNLLELHYHTDPNLNDTDGDSWLDGEEVLTYGTDPLDPNDYPTFPEEGIPGYEPILIIFALALFIPLLSKKVIKLFKK